MGNNQNVLVFTSGYGVSANGICAEALVNEMVKQGARVFVISFDSEIKKYDSENIFSVLNKPVDKKSATGVLGKCVNLVRDVLLHSRAPQTNDVAVRSAVNIAKNLCETVTLHKVVSIFFPVEAVVSAYEMKKAFPCLRFVVYELDSVTDGILGSSRYGGYIVNSYRRLFRKIYKSADLIMVHKSHRDCWLKEHSRFEDIVEFTDLPILCEPEGFENNYRSGCEYKFLYGGTLDLNYRSPEKLLNSFEKFNDFPWVMDFYSKGCEALLEAKGNLNVRVHGYVNKEELDKAVSEADFLLSMGNAVSNSLPSKIITYMAYGKPIIHFSLQEKDVCVEYLEKYPLSFIVKNDDDSTNDLKIFIEENKGKRVEFSKIRDLFPMNLPEYSVGSILT